MMMVRDTIVTLTRGRLFRNPPRLAIKTLPNREPSMPSRLVLAALMPRDVETRAREEFDAVVVEGKDDMTAAQVIEAASAHQADAIMFSNTLPLTADAIAQLPQSVRIGA